MCLFGFLVWLALAAFPTPGYGQDGWREPVDSLVARVIGGVEKGQRVFVSSLIDLSHEGTYYPFMSQIQHVMEEEVEKHGVVISHTSARADFYLLPTFAVEPSRLALNASLQSLDGARKELASVEIPADSLPTGWRHRSLQDVAYELTGKLEEQLVGQRLAVVDEGFSGGQRQGDGFVSELSTTMTDYLNEELVKEKNFVLLQPSDQHAVGEWAEMHGRYLLEGDYIRFRVSVAKRRKGGGTRDVAVVSARFPLMAIPAGMKIFPDNQEVAARYVDEKNDPGGYKTNVPFRVWTGKSKGVYRKNDRLVVHMRSEVDCHVRVFYIQSDGNIYQIFPSNPYEQDFLRAEHTYDIGGSNDDVELVITGSTFGQESIKVFASTAPISDGAQSMEFLQDVHLFRIQAGYRKLEAELAEGLNISNKRLLPVAETKVLVVK